MTCWTSERLTGRAGTLLAAALVLSTACARAPTRPDLVVASTSAAGWTTFALQPGPGVQINARVPPAIEFADGTVLRLTSSSLTGDSAYFAAPPSGSVPAGTPRRGIVRASICHPGERVCRLVVLPLAEP